MRRIGVSTEKMFMQDEITVDFAKIRAMGFDCADAQYFVNTENALFQMDEAGFEAHLKKERARAAAEGITFYQTHGPWRWPPVDNTVEGRAERLEKMSRSLRGSAMLGAKYMALHPIMPWGAQEDPEPEKFWQMNLAFYSRLLPVAEECGVVIGFENMPMPALCVASVPNTVKMIRDLNSKWIQLCHDTGHCIILGDEPADMITAYKDETKLLHIHDNDGAHDKHLLPGTEGGVIDWARFYAAVKALPEEVPVNIETNPTPEYVAYLRTVFAD